MLDWVPGDTLGLPIPAHPEALRAVGTSFITEAFRASGVLGGDNRVSAITRFEECSGGSTGRKVLLSVTYDKAAAGLQTELFVKFSRDFEDAIRDRGRIQMEREVRFALLSRIPGFPIVVPKCFFADYHQESGTGILVTERIAFGTAANERHYEKCLDYEMPEPLAHYQALIKALARLAAADRAGRLPDDVATQFPFDPNTLTVSKSRSYSAAQLLRKIDSYAEFARTNPQLLPQSITSSQFIAQLTEQAPSFAANELSIREFLRHNPRLIALCHWNAHVDNAWFWRNGRGELECGLLDWGHVSQMNVAMALGGCLTGAEPDLLVTHLEPLLALFAAEFSDCGAPAPDIAELKTHLLLYLGVSGLLLLDAPVLIQRRVPDLAGVPNRFHPKIRNDEFVRAQLHMLTVFLTLWQTQNFGGALEDFLRRRVAPGVF